MLAKVNELNKNVIILLSVAIIAVTSIVITLLVTSGGDSGNSSADSLEDFQEAFVKEYGVTPDISITLYELSKAQAETITKSMSKELDFGDAVREEYDGMEWYQTEDEERSISVNAQFK
ncbi:hypothetical protein [Cytobacillus pseudoceanisediminis]|uniref:hypothetical protein n=1 Tax=Cytobacillus pseudoceanisediminis TaxID=3051614 RepID=UPI003CF9CFFD